MPPLKSSKPNCWKLIGNDIVDLMVAAQESNWKRKGFLKKIFTEEEQLLIMSSQQPEVTLWLLWSMKEAAYKIYSRQWGIRSFAPTSLRCQLDPSPLKNKQYHTHETIKSSQLTKNNENKLMIVSSALKNNRDAYTDKYAGKVLIGNDTYLTRSTGNDQLIHTMCAINKVDITQIKAHIYTAGHPLFNNYNHTKPGCVSHHGAYLALVYLDSGFPLSVN